MDRFSTTNLIDNYYLSEVCPTILYLLAEPATFGIGFLLPQFAEVGNMRPRVKAASLSGLLPH